MRNYTTQMDAAKKGIITPEMKIVAKKEYRTEEEIRDLVAKGQVAICANKLHTCIDPELHVIRIDELNGETRIFGLRINTHDHNR